MARHWKPGASGRLDFGYTGYQRVVLVLDGTEAAYEFRDYRRERVFGRFLSGDRVFRMKEILRTRYANYDGKATGSDLVVEVADFVCCTDIMDRLRRKGPFPLGPCGRGPHVQDMEFSASASGAVYNTTVWTDDSVRGEFDFEKQCGIWEREHYADTL